MSNSSEVGNYFVPHPRHMRASFFPITEFSDFVWTALVALAFGSLGSAWGEFSSIAWVLGFAFWVITMWPVVPSKDERLFFLVLIAPVIELAFVLRGGRIWSKGKKVKYPYEVREIGPMGLIYHLERKTYSMVFYVDGSTISTYDLVSQMGQNSQIAQIIRRASAITGLKGLQFTFGYDVRPEDPFAVRYMLANMGNVDVLLPEVLATSKPESEYTREDRRMIKLRGIANEMEMMALNAAKTTMSITVTVKDNRAFQKIIREGYVYNQDIRRQTLVQITNALAALLKTVYENPRMLNGDQAEEHLRMTRDVARIQDFYARKMLESAAAEEARLNGSHRPVEVIRPVQVETTVQDVFHAPEENITAHSDCLEMDGTYAALIKLVEFELDQPPVNYVRDFSDVFNVPALYFSVNVTGQSKKGSIQFLAKDASNTVSKTLRRMSDSERSGILAEEAALKEDEELRRLRTSYTVDFVPSVVILSDDRDALDLSVLETTGQFTERQLGPSRVTGRFRQYREVLSALSHIPD